MKKTIIISIAVAVLSATFTFSSFAYKERYYKEDGSYPQNEWYQAPAGYGYYWYGGYTWRYFDADGYPVTNTTIDGYKVNDEGEWYEFYPKAPYIEARPNEVYQPFSYDGKEFKNDALGLCLHYTEDDYKNGYEIELYNASGNGTATFKTPDVSWAALCVGGVQDGKAIYESDLARDKEWNEKWGWNLELMEFEINGLKFTGTFRENDTKDYYQVWLWSNDHRGRGLSLNISERNGAGSTEANKQKINTLIQWLNTHLDVY